ncbi:MAG: peroxidase-related enzyme [Spirochaetales bacterium]|nr:peroxidase-related enzyme [Spirochaetales bacterium]
MARIDVIPPENATGALAEIYEALRSSRGKLAHVHTVQSLNPRSIQDHMQLYKTVMFASSPLTRAEREMMAVVVSATNRCRYCITHHGEALDHFWKNRERVGELARVGEKLPDLSEKERELCRYASLATRDPASPDVERSIERLRELDLDDRAILDATLVVSYFNFVNRIVLTLGVELEAEAGGYRYE